ncbi:MAG: VanZ family protein [Longimicrobiales bacterium]
MSLTLQLYAASALCLGCALPVLAAHAPPPQESAWSNRTTASPEELIQENEVGDDTAPFSRLEGQLFIYSLVVVMLIVPLIMARGPSHRSPPVAGPLENSRFSSARERRLWLWTLVVLGAIYSTLSPAQEVAAGLRERNLLGVTTTAVLLLGGVIVAVLWARTLPGRAEIGAALGVLAVYLTTLVRMPFPEARSHLFEYGLVAVLIYHALQERRQNGRRVPAPALLSLLATALLGWLDEGIQALLPNRVYDLVDVGQNAAFATMAIAATVVIGWARRLDIMARLRRRTLTEGS